MASISSLICPQCAVLGNLRIEMEGAEKKERWMMTAKLACVQIFFYYGIYT